jgi:hypothetical protein
VARHQPPHLAASLLVGTFLPCQKALII